MDEDEMVLCAASAYNKKYYLNPEFDRLPQEIREELNILCVLFTEDVGGTLVLKFDEEGDLLFEASASEEDLLYDEIGSGLKIRQLRQEKADLFESLEMYYRVFYLLEDEEE